MWKLFVAHFISETSDEQNTLNHSENVSSKSWREGRKGQGPADCSEKSFIIRSPVLRFLKPFNAFLLAVNHQLTTWTTLFENPFQIQSTVRSKKVGFILWIRGMNIHLTFCMEVGGKKQTGGIVAPWLKDFPAGFLFTSVMKFVCGPG